MLGTKINVAIFCNWHGLPPNDKFVLTKMFKENVEKTYDEWYDAVGNYVTLGARKVFDAPPIEQEVAGEPSEEKKPNTTTTKK